jgi:hypothetical protein
MEFVAVAILPVHKGRPTKGEKWAFRLARRTDRYSDSNVTAPISTLRSQNPALKMTPDATVQRIVKRLSELPPLTGYGHQIRRLAP